MSSPIVADRWLNRRPPTQKQLDRAKELGVWVHPESSGMQVQAAINWADPVYRAARRAAHARAMDKIKSGEGFLYVAEVIGSDVIKIGHALDLHKRKQAIWSDHGVRVRILAHMPAPLVQEKRLHGWLGAHRYKGNIVAGCATEFYNRTVLQHPAIPDQLRVAA